MKGKRWMALLLSVAMIFACGGTVSAKQYNGSEESEISVTAAANGRAADETVWDGSVDVDWSGQGTSASPYYITSASELAGLAEQVNSGNDYSGKCFQLTTDIDLGDSSSQQWKPIGTEDAYFSGNFDGCGYVISGIYIDSDENYIGLFGNTQNATITNVIIKDSHIYGGEYVGGIVGKIDTNANRKST